MNFFTFSNPGPLLFVNTLKSSSLHGSISLESYFCSINDNINRSKSKNADKKREVIKKLKSLKFESMDINDTIFINDSLCAYGSG